MQDTRKDKVAVAAREYVQWHLRASSAHNFGVVGIMLVAVYALSTSEAARHDSSAAKMHDALANAVGGRLPNYYTRADRPAGVVGQIRDSTAPSGDRRAAVVAWQWIMYLVIAAAYPIVLLYHHAYLPSSRTNMLKAAEDLEVIRVALSDVKTGDVEKAMQEDARQHLKQQKEDKEEQEARQAARHVVQQRKIKAAAEFSKAPKNDMITKAAWNEVVDPTKAALSGLGNIDLKKGGARLAELKKKVTEAPVEERVQAVQNFYKATTTRKLQNERWWMRLFGGGG